jgi:hypothetical protein
VAGWAWRRLLEEALEQSTTDAERADLTATLHTQGINLALVDDEMRRPITDRLGNAAASLITRYENSDADADIQFVGALRELAEMLASERGSDN